MFKKLLYKASLGLVLSSSTILPLLTSENNISNIRFRNLSNQQIEELYKDIEENRLYIGDTEYSYFDGKKFNSPQELDEYILKNNFVQMQLTSSNPSKIIKNYEHMTLDDKKIYDININNFSHVYRDAFGNIALSKENALNTYANLGNVKAKYSYDQIEWFDTPDEAKNNERYNLKINKSLYYIYANEYYNAFNQNDVEALISKFTSGYYVNKKTGLNQQAIKPINFFGTQEESFAKLKRELESEFYEGYYKKLLDTNSKYRIKFMPKKDYRITVQCQGASDDYGFGDYVNLEMLDNKTFNSWSSFLGDFRANWQSRNEGKRPYLTKTFNFKYNEKACSNGNINLMHSSYKNKKVTLDDFSYYDETRTSFTGYTTKDKKSGDEIWFSPEMGNAYTTSDMTQDNLANFYSKWFSNYFNGLQNFENPNKELTFKDLKNNNLNLNKEGSIAKDKLYDVNGNQGFKYSLIQSYNDFLPIKERILKEPYIIDNKTMYKMREDFYVTKEQLDNFLPLQGTFSSVLKYSYGTDKDLSSRDGKLLANTLEEAKEKEIINSKRTLQKKYIVYDAFGKVESSGESEEAALRKLHNNISLTAKYVHRDEIKTWDPNFKLSYDNIISDGRYAVYRIRDVNDSSNFIYYQSQDLALDAVKKAAKQNSNINVQVYKTYLYNYQTSLGLTIPLLIYDNDIMSTINKIIEIESSNIY